MEEARIQEFVRRSVVFLKDVVQTSKDEDIQSAMFEALTYVKSPAQILLTHNERHEIVDYWFKRYTYIPLNKAQLEELRFLKEYNQYLNKEGVKRLTELWTRKDEEEKWKRFVSSAL